MVSIPVCCYCGLILAQRQCARDCNGASFLLNVMSWLLRNWQYYISYTQYVSKRIPSVCHRNNVCI